MEEEDESMKRLTSARIIAAILIPVILMSLASYAFGMQLVPLLHSVRPVSKRIAS